jgi:hypothetical protein
MAAHSFSNQEFHCLSISAPDNGLLFPKKYNIGKNLVFLSIISQIIFSLSLVFKNYLKYLPGTDAHACNPSYSGGRDQKD